MCFDCFRFDHLKNQCSSKHCPNKDCQLVCVNCRHNYLPKDKSCPEWVLQVKVKSLAVSCNLVLILLFISPNLAVILKNAFYLPSSPTFLSSSPLPSYSHVTRKNLVFSSSSPPPAPISHLNPQNSENWVHTRAILSNRLHLLPPYHLNLPVPPISTSTPLLIHPPHHWIMPQTTLYPFFNLPTLQFNSNSLQFPLISLDLFNRHMFNLISSAFYTLSTTFWTL